MNFERRKKMSFFKKVLASAGIGSAKIDTKLNNYEVMIGDSISGVIEITGGNVSQEIHDIHLELRTSVKNDENYINVVISRFKVFDRFIIDKGEFKSIPFNFKIPLNTPITKGKIKVWIHTDLGIENGVDSYDIDYLNITGLPLMNTILKTITSIGFRLKGSDCEYSRYHAPLNFFQEFEYSATKAPYYGRLDELEIILKPINENCIEVFMEVDRRSRGFLDFKPDETQLRFIVNKENENNLKSELESIIQRYM